MFSWIGLRKRRETLAHFGLFEAVEADVRAMVCDPRWETLPVATRIEAIAARTLVTGEGDRWLYGAHARWHLLDPADGHWYPAAPPRHRAARHVEHTPGSLVPGLLPLAADFAADRGSVQAFVGPDVPPELTEQVRVLLRANGRRSELDYPLTAFGEIFAADVPSTVTAIWATIMWCAYAPAFDGNERLITIFGEYLGRPLPGDEWVRWLPAPRLADLVTLYAERLRAGKPRAALRLAALMADTAHILAVDARFRPRANALLAMVEPALQRPGLDAPAAAEGEESVRQAWLARCPAPLALKETDPGRHFTHVVYDLVESLSFAPDPIGSAAHFLTDLPDGERLRGWLDHRLRHAHDNLPKPQSPPEPVEPPPPHPMPPVAPEMEQTGAWSPAWDPMRTGAWAPVGVAPVTQEVWETPAVPEIGVEPPDRGTAASVLGAAYAVGLAWCRLSEAAVPAKGFAGAAAMVHKLTHERDDPHVNH